MANQPAANPHIIGLTGSIGSGCTYVADKILGDLGYRKISLSQILRELYAKKEGTEHAAATREQLQDFGDKVRNEKDPGYLAEEAVKRIDEGRKDKPESCWVVDSIRNPAEIRVLRAHALPFFLFGFYADKEIRRGRVAERLVGEKADFDRVDKNDTGEDSPDHGQRVAACFSEADIVLTNEEHVLVPGNDEFQGLKERIEQYVDLVSRPLRKSQPIRKEEALMAMAYAASQRSSCLKRKVGAVIVDGLGDVISSGFNEVPKEGKPCKSDYNGCYREFLRADFSESVRKAGLIKDGLEDKLDELFRRKFKILDNCRALHAEENAIVSLARNGRSPPPNECTLYTTTYPCRLCANKIVSVGIGRVVYLEPYPDSEAKIILEAAATIEQFFQGVTFRAYFRVYGDQK